MARNLPQTFNAGDTVAFSASFSDYSPADGYNLSYYIRGLENLTVAGSANGANDGWLIKITAKSTENFPTGLYQYSGRVALNDDAYTVEQGQVTINANLASSTQVIRLDHVQNVIRMIEDAIEGRITDDVQQFTIGGRSLMHIPVGELMDIRDRYKRELRKLQIGSAQTMINHKVVFTARE